MNRPSPSKQQHQQLSQGARKRRHSAISNGNAAQGSDDDDPDEPLAASNPLLKNSNSAGSNNTASTGGAATTTGGRKRGAKAAGWNPASVDLLTVGHAVDYRYTTEISQMVRTWDLSLDNPLISAPVNRYMYFAKFKNQSLRLYT